MVLAAVIGTACNGGEPSEPRDNATDTQVATPTAPSARTSTTAMVNIPPAEPRAAVYEALLATIPDIPEMRGSLQIDDYALARQTFPTTTFPLPGPGDDEEAMAAFNEWSFPLSPDESGLVAPILVFGASSFFLPLAPLTGNGALIFNI